MQPIMSQADSLHALLAGKLPPASLPPWVLAMLLAGWFVVILLLILKAKEFKTFAGDFPTHPATVIVGLACIMATAPVTLARAALGLSEFDGAGTWYTFVAALVGITGMVFGWKRYTAPEYQEQKTQREVAKAAAAAAAAPPPASGATGTFPIPVAVPVPVATPAPSSTAPAATAPSNAAIKQSLEGMAARQRFPAPDVEGSGD